MNIHSPPMLMFTRGFVGFDPQPLVSRVLKSRGPERAWLVCLPLRGLKALWRSQVNLWMGKVWAFRMSVFFSPCFSFFLR